MSEKPNDSMGPGEYLDLRRKLVSDALSKFSFTKQPKPTAIDALIIRARDVDLEVKRLIRPILQAGGGRDKDALRAIAAAAYLERFNPFTKEELENICSLLYLEMCMQFVDANPSGSDKPDLLGGV